MQPAIDQAIIANMRTGWMVHLYAVILIGGFLVMMIAGFLGYKKVFGYSAIGFLISFIVIYNLTTRSPTCSLCGSRLHQINQRISGSELKTLYVSENAPKRLQLESILLTGHERNQTLQGFECYHCRKMAIIA